MDIRNSMDGLRSLLGVNPTAPSAPQGKSSTAAAPAVRSTATGQPSAARRARWRRRLPAKVCARTRWRRCRRRWLREPTTCRPRRWPQDGGRDAERRPVDDALCRRAVVNDALEEKAERCRSLARAVGESGAQGARGRGIVRAGAPGRGAARGAGALVPGA